MSESTTEAIYVDDRDLERLTPIKRETWQLMRAKRRGPPYSKCGRRCIYLWTDVQAWINAQRIVGAS